MLPKKISVRGQEYQVLVKDSPIDHKGNLCDGTCSDSNKIIEISKDLTPDRQLEVFFHEWLHAIWNEIGFDDEDIPAWVEHMFIIAISKDIVLNKREIFNIFKGHIKK